MRTSAEREARWERAIQMRIARPHAPEPATSGAAAASRTVREDARPVFLYGWDNTAGSDIAFGFVGGAIGTSVGNPTAA